MALVVQKYGGTSMGTIERIRNVAKRVAKTYDAGNDMVVVVSAMSGETNKLVALANEVCEFPDAREYDVLVAAGEQVSIALLAMCLKSMGYKARSYHGWQVPIVTDSAFSKARIADINDSKMRADLNQGTILIVAGFQGMDNEGNITTLGRGGSDTSAVALAFFNDTATSEIYTDVDGVYTTDPNLCRSARKLAKVSYDEMLEMASAGAKVLHPRSVELAKKYDVPVYVKSSFTDDEGTLVTKEDEEMEAVVVSGVTYDRDQAKVTVVHVPDRPGIAARLFTTLSDRNIPVDMIIQNASVEAFTDLSFTVSKKDMKEVERLINPVATEIGAQGVQYDQNISKVSIIGVGMRSHAGVASRMFAALAKEGINILMISTSEIKISCVIESKYTELAVMVLHETFGLDRK